MLRKLLVIISFVGLIFAGDYPHIQKDFNWLKKMENKYSDYSNSPKDIYLKEYQSDGEQFQKLKEIYKEEILNNFNLRQQFQKTVAKMKKFMKLYREKLEYVKKSYHEKFQYAIDELKKAKVQKSLNALTSSQQAFKLSKRIYADSIKSIITDEKVLSTIRADWDRYEDMYHKISIDVKKDELSKTKKPKDKYVGTNKDKYKKMILSDWKEKYPKDKVLDVIFHMKSFRRTKTKKWNGATKDWRYRDTEVLAVTVAVKTSEDIITLYVAYINKDNLSGKLSTGVDTKGSEYVIKEMLSKNY